ncbi:MAG: hypothetical protein LHW61_05820 [Candidatus Cloacimonetes bacterium]|nr:hypothetical protein [Candidatus Cloacimonadota bacterium]
MKKKMLPFLIIMLFLLAGCVEYNEEMWLNPDGSGKVSLRLVHRSNYANTQEIMRKADLPGIHLISSQVQKNGPFMIYRITFKFDNIESFNSVSEEPTPVDFLGQVSINKNAEGHILYKRRIALGGYHIPESDVENDSIDINLIADPDDILANIYKKQQKDYPKWTYTLHAPWEIISASTTADKIDHKNKTVTWEFDTEQMWNKSELMVVEMKKGISWIVWVIIALAVLLLGFFIYWLVKIRHRSHLQEAINHNQGQENQQSQPTINPDESREEKNLE